jgi:hypothetical protein
MTHKDLHSVWLERNKKERVKEERNRRETLNFFCLVSREKEKREDCSVGPTQNLFLLSTAKKVERKTLLIFFIPFLPFSFWFSRESCRASSPPTFLFLWVIIIFLIHPLKCGDGPATSLVLSFLDLYSTTSRLDLEITNHRYGCIKSIFLMCFSLFNIDESVNKCC